MGGAWMNSPRSVKRRRGGRGAALLLLLGTLLFPAVASADWWNHDWSYRKQILVDASAKGGDLKSDLNDMPVLVRLHEGVFKFTDANPDGSDLRFVAEDDKTPLKYHVEKFDSVFNLAFVWVSVPKIKAGETTKIWMYYGNPKAANGGDARVTYDPDQVLVYHFSERGVPAADSTGYANNSATIGQVDESGLIGTATKFDGKETTQLPASSSLALASGGSWTWSVWLKPAAADEDGIIYARHDGVKTLLIGLSRGAPYVSLSDDSGAVQQTAAVQPLGGKGWHNVAVTMGQHLTLYIDGKPGPGIPLPTPAMNSVSALGGDAAAPGQVLVNAYAGEMDELQISRVARDPAYLDLAALNQGPGDKLVEFGADEQLSSWSSGYIGIILHSVTLDGWVVITLLLIMAVISWGVMAQKTGQINRVSRGNKAFLSLYRSASGDFGALNHLVTGNGAGAAELSDEKRLLVRRAPLFHMFSAGVEELRQRLAGDNSAQARGAYLTPQSIEAIRASLDSSLVQESQSLNKAMVLLTIAISGGPFIGLLGTVMGVMITFAAIAASGDVNINSIAPGIAAALVATVAGLIVAIPALFGYNYLITRVKDATAEMQVFLDAFVTRMAENYNEPRALRQMVAGE
ncbi:MAG: MotA/TolQ/ExbB proton channel family protein [Nevskia sp.]|nr:MotA/TolQ/ExbB proton channel family protein [Nevskia sp.]